MKIDITRMGRWKQEELIKEYEDRGYTTHLIKHGNTIFLKMYME